jgi:hypothetical protein
LANKFYLGKNPCGEEKPLSWDDELVEENITENDIKDALVHKNEQIRKAAQAYSKNTKSKD